MPRVSHFLFAVSAALGLIFVAWAVLALGDGALPAFDRNVALHMKQISADDTTLHGAMVAFTKIGSVVAMASLALAGACWQWMRGDKLLAISWALVVAGGGLFNLVLKISFDRHRPPAEWRDAAVHETNESFPSGHSMGGAIGYGMLAYALARLVKPRAGKAVIFVVAAAVVALIGFSRIYLRAHWLSDVLGGFAIGLAWLTFCLAWVELLRSRFGNSPS